MLVVVLVLENPDRFAMRLTEQIFAGHRSPSGHGIPMHTEDEHDDEDEDDSKFLNLGLKSNFFRLPSTSSCPTEDHLHERRS